LNPAEFLEMALLAFGIADAPDSKAQRICRIQGFLLDCYTQGKVAALIVDEAHKLSPETLEEIRLLGNFEFDDRKLLQIVLVGQSELRDVLNRDDLQQLKQRIAIQFSLKALTPAEVGPYMQHRWVKGGSKTPPPFTPAAIQLIARASRGTPRVINAVCDNALLQAFASGTGTVTDAQVRDVCRDLELFAEPPQPVPASDILAEESRSLAQAIKVSAPLAPLSRDLPPLRMLESYNPAHRPSWWARWTGRKVPAY
jgi:type II secretory pathway predicted ATPase ExeA